MAVAQTLTSVPKGLEFCNGSEVIFTCETRDSASLNWRGDNFYVQNQIGFVAEIDSINSTRNGIATLTENYLDADNVRVLVSTLRIMATSDAHNGNVTCVRANDDRSSIIFQVFGEFSHYDIVIVINGNYGSK